MGTNSHSVLIFELAGYSPSHVKLIMQLRRAYPSHTLTRIKERLPLVTYFWHLVPFRRSLSADKVARCVSERKREGI